LRKCGKYVLYLIGILITVYAIAAMENYIVSYRNSDFKYNVFYIVVSIVLAAAVGVILGMEGFIKETRKSGSWKISWDRLIMMCVPAALFSTYLVLFSKNLLSEFIVQNFVLILAKNSIFTYLIFAIILGHEMIGSFYKDI
jgi:hypothetical protein